MFEVVKSDGDFKYSLVRYMTHNAYAMPGDTDNMNYDSSGELVFPSLVSFIDTMYHGERRVYAKVCKKTIAKVIIYPKTNKLPRWGAGGWVVHGSVADYGSWLDKLVDDVYEDYGLNPDNVETPGDSVLVQCGSGKLFLSSYKVYFKENNDDSWLKIFLIPHAKAKELIYCNKKSKLHFTTVDTGYVVAGGTWGAEWNETAPGQRLSISSGVSQTVGYTAGAHVVSDTPEEVAEAPNTDGVQLFGGAIGENLSAGHNHGGLGDDDSPQYYTTADLAVQTGGVVEDAENHENEGEPPEEARAHGSPHDTIGNLYWDANVGLFVHMPELTVVHEYLSGETTEEEESTDQEVTERAHGSPHSSIDGVYWDSNRGMFVHPSELSGQVVVDDNGAIQVIEPPDPTDPVLNIDSNGLEWYGDPPEQAENTEEEEEQSDFIIEF